MSFLRSSLRKKAVAGYRHSAEDKQENSVPLQREFIHAFAEKHNIEIIHEEADEGVSGLTANRPGFRRLFDDWILNPDAPHFDYVIVYDVSRWGRFEDADEAGHYEFQCRQMGKEVIYARRGFAENEEQKGMFQVQTSFERWMSFQYSKKLSEDVIRGCLKISSQGYSVGGQAPYGMARLLLSAGERSPIRIMADGEHKSVANERITFVPKGDQTTSTIQRIFTKFLDENNDLDQIAKDLNESGITSAKGGEWNREKLRRILSNQTYKGTLIYNKTWGRLKRKKKNNHISDWIICPNAFTPVVDPKHFDAAQEKLSRLSSSHDVKGRYLLRKIKKSIDADIRSVLVKNEIDQESARHIPIVLAAKRYLSDKTPYRCFMITPAMKGNKEILCISVDTEIADPIDRRYVIPTKAFDILGMCFLSEKDEGHLQWSRNEDEMESAILTLSRNQ